MVEAASQVSVGEQIPHNWCRDKWLSIQIKMNLYFTPHTEISSRWIKTECEKQTTKTFRRICNNKHLYAHYSQEPPFFKKLGR